MRKTIEKDFVQIRKHVFVQIFSGCYSRVSIVFLCKLYLFGSQPSFNLCFCGVPRSQHPLLMAHFSLLFFSRFSLNLSHLLNPHLFLPTTTKPFVDWTLPLYCLSYWPRVHVFQVSNKASKTIGLSSKPKGNIVHRVHCAVSPEIALNGWL